MPCPLAAHIETSVWMLRPLIVRCASRRYVYNLLGRVTGMDLGQLGAPGQITDGIWVPDAPLEKFSKSPCRQINQRGPRRASKSNCHPVCGPITGCTISRWMYLLQTFFSFFFFLVWLFQVLFATCRIFIIIIKYFKNYLFLALLGLHCFVRAFSS